MLLIGPFEPLFSCLGFVVGMLIGITGVGGASLMTPILVLFFGVHPVTAVGTDLIYAAITKTAGVAVHHKHGTVCWPMMALLASGSVPAALVTLWLLSGMDRSSLEAAALLSSLLGWVLLITAAILLAGGALSGLKARLMANRSRPSPRTIKSLTIALGILLGVIVTITSVGAGAIGVTVLLMLYPRYQIQEIVGSDIAHAIPLTMVAGLGYMLIGEIDWFMLIELLLGSIPGIIAGSYLAPRMPETIVRRMLAVTLAVVGLKLIAS